MEHNRWKPLREVLGGFTLLLGLLAVAGAADSAAGGVQVTGIEVGWNGLYKVGLWTPVTVQVTSNQPQSVRLELVAPDPEGNLVTFPAPPVMLTADSQPVRAFFQVGRLDSPLTVRLTSGNETLFSQTLRPVRSDQEGFHSALRLSTSLIATLGDPAGLDFVTSEESATAPVQRIRLPSPTALPMDALAYDALNALVIAGDYQLPEPQSAALEQWVRRGGHLVLAVGTRVDEYSQSPLSTWVPVPVTGELQLRDLSGLESFSGKTARLVFEGRVSAARLGQVDGQVLISNRDDTLLVRAPYGVGRVTFLALDLDRPPLSQWEGLPGVVERMVFDTEFVESNTQQRRGMQLVHAGITDLATQLHAIQDHFPEVVRSSHWMVMGLLLLYVLLIGPLDYLLVHRVLKKPHLTWFTFPLLMLVAAGLTIWSARTSNGTERRLNQLDVVDLDAVQGEVRTRSWVNLYSPAMERYAVAVQPANTDWTRPASETPPNVQLSWYGVPEDTFGGLYYRGGLELGRTRYGFAEGLDRVEDLPIALWSTRSLTAAWDYRGEPLAESTLRASGLGRLTGTITHHLPVPIEDWVFAYGNRVYRAVQSGTQGAARPLPPRQPWSPADPTVSQRELKGYLTRAVARRINRKQGEAGGDVINEQAKYDPQNLNPSEVLQMLTFHEEAGGTKYTGLTNTLLHDFDLSRELRLGRAVLFGRIDRPAAQPHVNGEAVEPSHQATFIRIVLPVERSTEPAILPKPLTD